LRKKQVVFTIEAIDNQLGF